MPRRKALEIKKHILRILKQEGELSLRDLDIKVGTNSRTVRTQVDELVFFEKVEILKYPKSERNGRPYTAVRLKCQSAK